MKWFNCTEQEGAQYICGEQEDKSLREGESSSQAIFLANRMKGGFLSILLRSLFDLNCANVVSFHTTGDDVSSCASKPTLWLWFDMLHLLFKTDLVFSASCWLVLLVELRHPTVPDFFYSSA